MRHPRARPSARPRGMPKIIATEVPVMMSDIANEERSGAATRTA